MENETRIFNIHPHLSIFNFHPLIKNKSRAFNLQMLTRKASTVSFAVKVEQTGLEEIIVISKLSKDDVHEDYQRKNE